MLGSIVFGPIQTPTPSELTTERYLHALGDGLQGKYLGSWPCNCIGPQPGQTKCPCMLRGESEMGRKMIKEGITIDGKRYRLIPE